MSASARPSGTNIRLQAPFIVPHRKSSNVLKNDQSRDGTVYANITQTKNAQTDKTLLIRVCRLATKTEQKPDT